MLNQSLQRNVLCWERVDPPWELPDSVGQLVRALQETQAWIASGGIIKSMVVAAPPTLPQPALSDGESEVTMSNGELPVSKVQWSDEVEHTLDKGLWVGIGATQRGWKIFVKVSRSFHSGVGQVTDSLVSGPVDGASPHMSTMSRTSP